MAEYSEGLLIAAEQLKKVAAENLRKQGIDVNDPRRTGIQKSSDEADATTSRRNRTAA